MAAGTSSWLIVWMTGCSAPNVIPGSIHFESLKHALDTLDPKEEVIVYCSNFGCTASVLVYQQLVDHGFQNVRHYAGGIADWEDAGYPLEGDRVNRSQSEA